LAGNYKPPTTGEDQVVVSSEIGMRRRERAGILSAPLITLGIILVNELVFLLFLQDTSFPLRLLNNWTNFPLGLVTAIFTPDSQVFLCYTGSFQASVCYASYLAWLVMSAGSLGAYLVLFFVVNLGQSTRELAVRSTFYAVMIIAISAVSNYLGLLREPGSIGPSTAIFAGLGIVLGFAASNSIVWLRTSRALHRARDVWAIGLGIALVIGLLGFALRDPADFFNISSTQKVDATAHVFCFVVGTLTSVPVGLRFLLSHESRPTA